MAIDRLLWPIYREFFSTITDKRNVLMSGYQEVEQPAPVDFNYLTVQDGLNATGHHNALSMDLQDGRADLIHDLNTPIKTSLHGKFDVLIDMGTIEHVADSVMAFWNYFKVLRVGGILMILTPVCGYYDHGFHTFSPEFLEQIMVLNGFEIIRTVYANIDVGVLNNANEMTDVLTVVIAEKKTETPGKLVMPQQRRWER